MSKKESIKRNKKGPLPSQVCRELAAADDPETSLLRILSVLAHRPNLRVQSGMPLSSRIWNVLNQEKTIAPTDSHYEWWIGIRYAGSLLLQLNNSFEVHAVAIQSIVFTDGSCTHVTLCIMICIWALRHLEKSPTRWKRCQSLMCETIRLYQQYANNDLSLWTDHMIPACLYVSKQVLPKEEALHAAIKAALIGTTTRIAVDVAQQEDDEDDHHHHNDHHHRSKKQLSKRPSSFRMLKNHHESKKHILLQQLMTHAIEPVIDDNYHSIICCHSWRVYSERCFSRYENSHLEFLQRKNDLAWWTEHAYRDESVAGMDTSWDSLGIVLLSMNYFDAFRPWSPEYKWNMYFPQVHVLCSDDDNTTQWRLACTFFLEKLVHVIPKRRLEWRASESSKKPNSPIPVFCKCQSRIMATDEPNKPFLVDCMNAMLSCYKPISQVKMIRKLLVHCRFDELKPRLLDMLRPIIKDESAADPLWSLVGTFLKELFLHESHSQLQNVEVLRNNVELYVSAITMIQLYMLTMRQVPIHIHMPPMELFYETLTKTLERWMNNALSMPPDDYFRLYLLEGALKKVLQVYRELETTNRKEHHHAVVKASQKTTRIAEVPPAH